MQITFIRHLPTEWNKKTWLQGKRDIGITALTKNDSEEIEENKTLLKIRAPFDLVLASTLKRTQETAFLYGFEPEIEHLLDELDFGPFEGVPKRKLTEELGSQWEGNPLSITLGEPVRHLEERIISFLQKYKTRKNILAFGHGAWIRAALSYVKYGHINQMNRIEVKNNDCLSINI
ncbi:histidine phosphatase family protein [Siminovitchia acidinfaciens]|uniref:Histidine phosphatase family protein n=1 Tax=Siminovitchia acidinfaciens TaxID=2321395 RepID=A0A429XX67_9BACI|nr:histidine phosphatase family protein [Siminovitchia acidinfaciens]RST73066.1 histidine phosphatase family protein [Siminovitchia acidinfaciens]